MASSLAETLQLDDLLDFSHFVDIAAPPIDEESPLPSSPLPSFHASSTPLPSSAEPLYVPPEELAELEWLSTFVEDSYTVDNSFAAAPLLASGFRDEATTVGRSTDESVSFESRSPISVLEESNVFSRSSLRPINGVVKGRPRSKRSRTGGRVWFHLLVPSSPLRNKTSVEELSEASQSSSLDYEEDDWFLLRKSKAMKVSHTKKFSDNSQQRRCTHCQVQKTPQWRAGPMGPKTLCNACGVRYKSGRLVPEYRPAGSPSFINEIHSNSHKKILEMRRYKYENWPGELQATLSCTENHNTSSDTSMEMEQCITS